MGLVERSTLRRYSRIKNGRRFEMLKGRGESTKNVILVIERMKDCVKNYVTILQSMVRPIRWIKKKAN